MPDFNKFQQIRRKLQQELGNWVFFMEYKDKVDELAKE